MVLLCSCKSDSSTVTKTWSYATTDASQVKTLKITLVDNEYVVNSGATTMTYGDGTVRDFEPRSVARVGSAFTIDVTGIGNATLDETVTILYHFEDSAGKKVYMFSGPCTTVDDVKTKIIPSEMDATKASTLYFSIITNTDGTTSSALYGPLQLQ